MSQQIADVWSCGVTLYVMLVGAYPFEDPQQPKDFRKTIQVIILSPLYLLCMPVYPTDQSLEFLSFLRDLAENCERPVFHPGRHSDITRMLSFDIKNLRRCSCSSKNPNHLLFLMAFFFFSRQDSWLSFHSEDNHG